MRFVSEQNVPIGQGESHLKRTCQCVFSAVVSAFAKIWADIAACLPKIASFMAKMIQ